MDNESKNMTKLRIVINAVFLLGIFSACVIAQEKADDVIRIDTSLVNIPAIVSDRNNRYIPGLTVNNFRVFQDGVEQKIEVFNNEQAPMNIVIALDTSRSTESVLGKIKKAAREFIKDMDSDDRAMIVTFDYEVNVLNQLTSDKKELDRAIKDVRVGEFVGTVLNDAVYTAIRNSLRDVKGRKAVILLTDGKDHGSSYTQRALIDRLTESDTVIYPIFYETGELVPARLLRGILNRGGNARFPGGGGGMARGRGGMGRFPGGGGNFPGGGGNGQGGGRSDPNAGRTRPNVEIANEAAIEFLERLAEITGGRFFKEKKADLKDAFLQIADEMKRQYLLAFYPNTDSPAGTIHRIKVQVDRPDTVVRTKGAYRTQVK